MYALTPLKTSSIVYTIFGIQQHSTDIPSPLSTQLTALLTPHLPPGNTSTLAHPGPGPLTTTIHLTYWPTKADYERWWHSDPVMTFWGSLPDDAGIYRETITVASDRTQHATNKPQNIGMGCLGPCAPLVDKTGYWGCYYHRIPAIASASGPEGRLPSPLKGPPRKRDGTGDIRHGRVRMTRFPENLCFVVEGQDHSGLTDVERETWFGKFDASATGWLSELQSAGSETGLLDKRMCYDPRSGRFRDGEPEEFGYNRKVQLFYFLDMECMERMGRMSKVHVQLRKDFLKAYGPGGELAETGGICLWVETSILKAGGLDCEYVGCWDGTGLMGFEWDSA
ncbi:hem-containing dehydratase protein [Aspergillus pseudonomiae]|uniref:Hem-containing dehydratase protein n=1 Tax=Aspergillus pseudonomiae TaxID=1506151 RepID=A0A5N6IHA2_9EURO|nr:hem-containing dehydratase protein [Aspergillus pseudonomiae]KAB8266122.1 hem-containing dehydratase protein [Aspergillus pseudonomiae]KAE8408989.1 hem-containing dehydratase protein [Aspergillus pseudonomiae]